MTDTPNRPTLDRPAFDRPAFDRPAFDHPDADADADAAVRSLIRSLQDGYDTGDADRYDATFAADVLWGTPKGQWVKGFDTLNGIHRRMMDGTPVAPSSTFELVQMIRPQPGMVIAQIRRSAHDGGFSEVALYVLVREQDTWWLTAAQNTPVNDVLPSPEVARVR